MPRKSRPLGDAESGRAAWERAGRIGVAARSCDGAKVWPPTLPQLDDLATLRANAELPAAPDGSPASGAGGANCGELSGLSDRPITRKPTKPRCVLSWTTRRILLDQRTRGEQAMAYRQRTSLPTWTIAGVALACALGTGCQSKQRWAMWSPFSRSPKDESMLARTAPQLPSEVAKAAEKGGAQGDTSLAAAPPFKPGIGLPSLPPSVTAPPASPYNPTTGGYAATSTPAAAAIAAAAPAKPGGSPYDPSGYQPPKTAAYVPSVADRYGASSVAGVADRYATSSTPSPTPPAPATPPFSPAAEVNRFATAASAVGDRYATQASNVTSIPEGWSIPGEPAAPTTANVAATPASTQSVATATAPAVKLPAAAGQYRPGGTSTYAPEVSVADRQGGPTYPTTSTTQGAASPASYR